MFNKKSIALMLIVIIGLVAISAVSAVEENATDIVSIEENEEISLQENSNEDILIVENENNKLTANPDTLKNLNDTVNGNNNPVVTLTTDYAYDSNVDGAFKNGIIINRDVTIDGQGHIINGYGGARAFNVSDGSTVVFKNITFYRCASYSDGAAVIGGTSINCNFTDNTVITGGAGAIYLGTAVNCTFTRNSAINANGGAIYDGFAINCTFIENSACWGGAMYQGSAENCTFVNNVAEHNIGYGGAIYECSARNCNFTGNKAEGRDGSYGGAARNSDCFNCIFTNNTAGCGGAGYEGTYRDCTFQSNNATHILDEDYGGGALFEPELALNCTFIDNKARDNYSSVFGGLAVMCTFENDDYDEYNTDVYEYPTIIADDFTCIYNEKDVFTFKTMAGETEVKGIKTCFRIDSRDGEPVYADLEHPSGQDWVVNLEPGSYDVSLYINGYQTQTMKNVVLTVTKYPTTLTLNTYNITKFNNETYNLIATLKDYNNTALANFIITTDLNDMVYYTDENGMVTIPIKNLTVGQHNITVKFDGDGYYAESSAVVMVVTVLVQTEIRAEESYHFTYNQTQTMDIALVDNQGKPLSGLNLTVDLNGIKNYTTDEDGQIHVPITGIAAGNYTANITLEGNEVYTYASFIADVTIEKAPIRVFAESTYLPRYGDDLWVNITVKYDDYTPVKSYNTVNVKLCNDTWAIINETNYTTDENGNINILIKDLPVGYYWANLTLYGNENFTGHTNYERIIMNKAIAELYSDNLVTAYASGENLTVALKDSKDNPIVGVNLTVDLNGIKNYTTDEYGQIYVPITGIAAGNYTANITLEGNECYKDVSLIVNVTIEKASIRVFAESTYLPRYGDDLWVNITVKYDDYTPVKSYNTVNVKFYNDTWAIINETNYTTDENGNINILIKDLPVGYYWVNMTLYGNENFTGHTNYERIIMNKGISLLSAGDLNMSYKDGSAWVVNLTDNHGNAISGLTIKIGIVGVVYNCVTDADGLASLPINLVPGTYAINATFENDGTYKDSFVNATVTVGKAVSTLTAEDITMDYKNGSWIVTLTGAEGVIPKAGIKFAILGKVYTLKTDDNGVASLPINLTPGTYEVNATFGGNYKHEAAFIEATVTVEKATATIASEDLTMFYKDGSAYSVTVTDANGAALAETTVKFTFGTKSYNIKTDANGVAALPINLNIGVYTVNAVVVDAKYTSEEVTNTVIVTDYDAFLVTNDINMTYQDGTNYEVQLTTPDGVPIAVANLVVKITILGKTYSIKTDAEGIAKLPINLKAGNYTVTAEYNGAEITNTIVVNKA